MPSPQRTVDANYHFHVYDYNGSAPFQESGPVATRNGWTFYSMVQDLQGLQAEAVLNNVPNPQLQALGAAIPHDGLNGNTWALSFGGGAGGGAGDPEVFIAGGIHAREWIAPEMAYLIAEYIIRNYALAPATAKGIWLRDLVDSRRIHIVPMLNPAGNAYTVNSVAANSRFWRRNRRPMPITGVAWAAELANMGVPHPPFQNVVTSAAGITRYDAPRYPGGALNTFVMPNAATTGVDLARNYGAPAYGTTNGPNFNNGAPDTEAYFGTHRHSEIETLNITAFLAGLAQLETSVDYHSYSKLVLYPTVVADAGLAGNYANLGEILQRLIGPRWTWGYDYQLGSPRALLGYDATGTPADYIAAMGGAQRAFVIELDPAGGAGLDGFVLPQTQIRTVFEKNIRGALALIAAAGQPSTLGNRRVCCCFNRRTITSGERALLEWSPWGRGNRLPT